MLITRTEQVVVSAVPADIAGTPQVAHSNAMLAFCSTASDRTQWSYEWTRLPGRAAPARPRTSGGRRPPFDLAQPRDVAGLVGVDLGRLDERPDHLDRHLRGQPLQAHRQHVRVVPEPGTLGDPRVPRERRPHARYLVRRDRGTGTGPAHHHAVVGGPAGHRPADRLADVRPLVRGRDRDHFVAATGQVLDHGSGGLVLVIRPVGYPHDSQVTEVCGGSMQYRPLGRTGLSVSEIGYGVDRHPRRPGWPPTAAPWRGS